MQYSPNKKYIATASRDKTVKIWDAENLKVLARIDKEKNEGHVNSVNTLQWMSDEVLLTAGDDRSIIAWKVE
jgi:WD40 repeat protein